MRHAILAPSLIALLLTVVSASAAATRPIGAGGASERAARAEQRSRVETTRVCRGCDLALRPARRTRNIASRPVRARRNMRSTTLWAPIPGLPLTSRAEAQVQALNRTIALQQQRVHFQQQIQFELNQLRHELQLHRDYLFP
jgi:hypothetical protein